MANSWPSPPRPLTAINAFVAGIIEVTSVNQKITPNCVDAVLQTWTEVEKSAAMPDALLPAFVQHAFDEAISSRKANHLNGK